MAPPSASAQALDPLSLVLASSGVVLAVLVLLVIAAVLVWVIWILKVLQVGRLLRASRAFEAEAANVEGGRALAELALARPEAPGARIVVALARGAQQRAATHELLLAVGRRALATEQQALGALMPTLSSIASASPFIGLFGTVWGIMNAFLRIGVEKSASLPVVAPAIGEALIATAVGLLAAIPATIAYNYVDRRIGDLMDELEAASGAWAELLLQDRAAISAPLPLVRPSERPAPGGG